jgi:hypothetical protein
MKKINANPYRDQKKTGLMEIFETYPQLQNNTSSMWFFFLLFPKQENGFGPKQMMYTFASKIGKSYGVNGIWQDGMKLNDYTNNERNFITTAVGWLFDGKNVHEDIVHQPVNAKVSRDGWIKAWSNSNNELHGGEFKVLQHNKPRMHVKFQGKNGFADFEVWAEDEWELSNPGNYDKYNKFYSSILIAWRKFNFKGRFGYNNTVEEHEGIGYFQRVCLNVPMMPWFWPIIVFPDGSIFSSFQPYFGLNNFRKEKSVKNSIIKRIRLNLGTRAYYADYSTKQIIRFDETDVHTIKDTSELIIFEVNSKNSETGDFVKIHLKSIARTGFTLEKYLYDHFHSLHNYNEHIVKVVNFEARLFGKDIDNKMIGNAFGNVEYCWGMSI